MNVRLYFTDGMPARADVADHLADVVDLPVAIGALASRIAGLSLREISLELSGSGTMSSVMPNDSTRSRRRRQPFDRPRLIQLRGRQPAADVVDAEARQHAQDRVGVAVLRAGFHARASGRLCPAILRLRGDSSRYDGFGQRADRQSRACKSDEVAAIHRSLHTRQG